MNTDQVFIIRILSNLGHRVHVLSVLVESNP
jgi:hypothetical protein